MRLLRCAVAALALAVGMTLGVGSVSATVSGENGLIAFVTDRDGNPEIYTMNTDGSNLVNLSNNPASDHSPSWSPDGVQIAFVSNRGGADAIYLMNGDGTNVRYQVQGTDPAWSPDGTRIAFVTGSDIYVMNLDNRSAIRITDSNSVHDPDRPDWFLGASDSDPAWSPDGTRIAFSRHYQGPTPIGAFSRVYVVDAGGKGPPAFLADSYHGTARIDWAPDGTKVVFGELGLMGTTGALIVVNADGSNRVVLPKPAGLSHVLQPSWSPDGALIASAGWLINTTTYGDIFSMGVDGSNPVNLTDHPAWDTSPAWQPLNPYPAGMVDPTTGIWYLRDATGKVVSFYYGVPGDEPFMGDWDCDGDKTPGLYRRSDGYVYLRNSNTQGIADIKYFFGNPGDTPLAGDFDGDGCDTVSIYRPSEVRVYIINRLGEGDGGLGAADYSYLFGIRGDKPFVGDFDGDGIDTVGLHREATGRVYYRNTNTQGVADNDYVYGIPGDRIITSDWNGDGRDTPAAYRPSNQTHYFRFYNAPGFADAQYMWGRLDWIPVATRP